MSDTIFQHSLRLSSAFFPDYLIQSVLNASVISKQESNIVEISLKSNEFSTIL